MSIRTYQAFVVCLLCLASETFCAELTSGIDAKGFDRSVRPQDDLFLHVNGEWILHTPIPDDKSNYGSFLVLQDEALLKQREIIEQAAAEKHPAGSDKQKVGDFYRSFMDEEHIEQLGVQPLREMLAEIDDLADLRSVITYLGRGQTLGVGGPIGFYVDQDDKDSTRYLAAIIQSGTTLPDRDYYLEEDEKYAAARQALQDYIGRLFQLAGLDAAADVPANIVALEKKLAAAQWPRTELRNADKRYNKFVVDDLAREFSKVDWKAFFAAAEVAELNEVNVNTPSFFVELQSILQETPVDLWKWYLKFNLLDSYAPALSKDFVDAHFELHRKQLAGVPQQQPRWKRAVEATAGSGAGSFGVLGDSVGRLYVAEHFPPQAKDQMETLVDNLLRAYEVSIQDLTWMTPETKQKAMEKLKKIRTKIGYTTKWRDYSKLEIKPDDLLGNLLRSGQVEYHRMIDKLGKPVDREEWGMTPQTVNAYYNPSLNEIVFPAAILQPPFFDPNVENAVNYGGIGAVIGHEISHGFDDQGSKYDGDGNLENWWTEADSAAFKKLTQQLVNQFSSYEALPDKRVNGELTLGENIADLSGMSIAYKAYILSLN
ncbi:MAG: M13 family metallopeptidase, partial [Planctomycetales bacterium]|nr:M13 family metallopeptidase [Planctomycetales bacterium]